MAISLRLDSKLDQELSKCAEFMGTSKSELIRILIDDFVKKNAKRLSPWELGKDFFGREGSGKSNLSVDRKTILKEKLDAKKSLD
ncbi:MAG: hypothetical protein A2161_18330 [Candidatus Schekmanbacteria bacterium RBG_13_48_7]|uniref:Ribbon-helix-helix protein CopG domain-containing protein n=1 Tax=Candidatus Schekmanbacteria bacterium RBG_13_48_7 TaxID=1817878 RepID=A0A1F7RYV8_9BACT|nr:MAG: hypothetical protein A2161_18330 [Candidatus Schekmanbacteria bacterium RBG_13_48_7]